MTWRRNLPRQSCRGKIRPRDWLVHRSQPHNCPFVVYINVLRNNSIERHVSLIELFPLKLAPTFYWWSAIEDAPDACEIWRWPERRPLPTISDICHASGRRLLRASMDAMLALAYHGSHITHAGHVKASLND